MHLAIASAVACTTAISWSAAEPTTAWPQVVRDGDRAFTLFAPCFVSYDGANVLIEQAVVRGDGALRAAGRGVGDCGFRVRSSRRG